MKLESLIPKTDEEWRAWEKSDLDLDAIAVPDAWRGLENTYTIALRTAQFCDYVEWKRDQGILVSPEALQALKEFHAHLMPAFRKECKAMEIAREAACPHCGRRPKIDYIAEEAFCADLLKAFVGEKEFDRLQELEWQRLLNEDEPELVNG